MSEKNLDRRSFFTMALTALAIVPVALKGIGKAEAADACPKAPLAGKQMAQVGVGMAKSLEYTDDGKASKHAKHKPGQNCVNCKYYNDKKAEGGYAPCTMMGMKYVSNCGWCKSYLAK